MVIHFCWSGPNYCYADYLAVVSAFKVHRPDSVYLWSGVMPQDNLWWERTCALPYVDVRENPYPLDGACTFSTWSNYVRYRALYDYGGMYLDFDTISLKPFAQLLDDGREVLAGRETSTMLAQGILFVRSRGCRLFQEAAEQAVQLRRLPLVSGPRLFTRLSRQYPNVVQALARNAFYYFPWQEAERYWEPHDIPESALMLHYFGKFGRSRAQQVRPGVWEDTMYHRAVVCALGEWEIAQD